MKKLGKGGEKPVERIQKDVLGVRNTGYHGSFTVL